MALYKNNNSNDCVMIDNDAIKEDNTDHSDLETSSYKSSKRISVEEDDVQYSNENENCLDKFIQWSQRKQVEHVEQLLLQMSHFQHGQIKNFLRPMLMRDFITELSFRGLSHIAENILSYLDDSSLRNASLVSPTWSNIISNGYLWMHLIESKINRDTFWYGLSKRLNLLHFLRALPGGPPSCLFDDKEIVFTSYIDSPPLTTAATDNNNQHIMNSSLPAPLLGGNNNSNAAGMDISFNKQQIATTSNNNLAFPSTTTSDMFSTIKYLLPCTVMCPDFYKEMYPIILNQMEKVESNWLKGNYSLCKIECHSEGSKGVYCLQYDDHKIICGLRDNTIKIYDAHTLECCRILVGHSGSVLCLQYDDNLILSGSSDSTVRVWLLNNFNTTNNNNTDNTSSNNNNNNNNGAFQCANILNHHRDAVLHLRFQNNILVTCSKDRTIAVLDIISPCDIRFRSLLEAHRAAVNVVDFDLRYIVSASGDRSIKVWNTMTCDFVRTLSGHKRGIACLQYRDKLVVSGSSDNTIRLWNIECGTCIRVLMGHRELVRCIRFNEKYIVSGSYDGEIKLWDLKKALNIRLNSSENFCIQTLSRHTGRVFRLQFDDFQIVSSSHDDTILIWDFLNTPNSDKVGGGGGGSLINESDSISIRMSNTIESQGHKTSNYSAAQLVTKNLIRKYQHSNINHYLCVPAAISKDDDEEGDDDDLMSVNFD